MSDVLTRICADKQTHIAAQKAETALSVLQDRIAQQSPTRGFAVALKAKVDAGGYGLIAELKKASPSKGLIRDDFDPPSLAKAYETGGAACLSVLTDIPYFQGDDAFLIAARKSVNIPVLRKDFMLDPYQVTESRALGADCILLIMAALSDAQALELEEAATALQMDVLVEIHNREELDRALELRSPLLGINNRNLKTLEVDIKTTEELSAHIPDDKIMICESGLFVREDLDRMARVGAHCFLIGESLMRQDDVAGATRNLLSPSSAEQGAT